MATKDNLPTPSNPSCKEKSPLYKLSSKKFLSYLLKCDIKFFKNIESSRDDYKIWVQDKSGGGGKRNIEEPKVKLKFVQKRLSYLLKSVETPCWLKSGKKKESYITNAKVHIDCSYMLCVDIKSFYPTASSEFVFRCFKNEFLMAENIAWILTKIVTIPNEENDYWYLPTGTATSQLISFWGYKKTFEEINALAEKYGIRFSLYVDDMTFSSKKKISRKFVAKVESLLNNVGLKINNEKTEFFSKTDFKVVTGNSISPENQLLVLNRHRKSIVDMVYRRKVEDLNDKELLTLTGRILSCMQIEPGFFEHVYNRARKEMKARRLN